MITPFYGELLLQPIPLELSLNYCSHKCAYCFANLNKPDRRAAPQSIVNLLAEMDERETVEAQLLRRRYPVMMSNKVDPFAASNWRLSLQILELFAALKIPVAFQTKGGKGIDEAMELIGPSCFYVTITCADDETCRRIEPGAPLVSERLTMMRMLRERGHHVWVGANPLVRQWIPDVKSFAKRLADEGVKDVWSEVLHLSSDQVTKMSERQKQAMGAESITDALARHIPQSGVDFELSFIEALGEHGINFGCKHWPGPSHVVDAYAAKYPMRFPTMTEFTDQAWATMQPGDEFTFREWAAYMLARLPDIHNNALRHYVHSCSRDLGKRIRYRGAIGFEDVLRTIWIERNHKMCPSRSRVFKKVFTVGAGGEKIYKLCADNLPVRQFTGKSIPKGGEQK